MKLQTENSILGISMRLPDLSQISSSNGFHTRVATDVDEHATNLSGWEQLYDQLSPGRFHGSVSEVWMGRLQIFRESTSHTLRQSCKAWKDSWWFGIPTEGGDPSKLGSHCLSEDTIAVQSGNTEFELLTPDSFTILGVVVGQDELMEHALATEHVPVRPKLLRPNLLDVGEAKRSAIQALVQQILNQVAQFPGLLSHEASRKSIRSSILQGLTDICCTRTSQEQASDRSVNHHSLVFGIREYVLEHRGEPVTISDMCRQFGVSRRTLQNAFQNVVGMRPVQFLRAVRLNEVRRILRHRSPRIGSVHDAAARCGFWHLSQFARDYKKLFGDLPSESLRQNPAM
jgi:AraC family ethanolamine operon transcriptional activator